jgi:hypothetical protein
MAWTRVTSEVLNGSRAADGNLQADVRSIPEGRRAFAEVGREAPEIATITGHSLKDVEAILDAHYLDMTTNLAASPNHQAGARRHGHGN